MKHIFPIKDSAYRSALGVNQSILKSFAKCPAEVKYQEERASKPPTDAQLLGLLTEARLFHTTFEFAQSPFENFRTNEAKAWKKARKEEGMPVIDTEDWYKSDCMLRALENHEDVKPLLKSGRASMALFGKDEQTGLLRKGLIDWIPNNDPYIVDLKTSHDCSPWAFGGQIASYRYDIQDASYTRLWRDVFKEDRTFVFIVIQSSEPWHVAVYSIKPQQRQAASDQYDMWMARYLECSRNNDWPGFTKGIALIDVPKYVSIPIEPL